MNKKSDYFHVMFNKARSDVFTMLVNAGVENNRLLSILKNTSSPDGGTYLDTLQELLYEMATKVHDNGFCNDPNCSHHAARR